MPTEDELRTLLHGEAGAEPRLDAESIIRRARARRRPKRMAVGALSGFAVLAVIVPVAVGLGSMQPMGASDEAGTAAAPESADDASTLVERGRGGSLADDPYPDCRLKGWDGAAVPSGVQLLVAQLGQGGGVDLTLVNDSSVELSGELAGAPYLALGSGAEPLGWSAAPVEPLRVHLAPGERMTITVPLDPVGCDGSTLSGAYDVDVSLGILLDDGTVAVANSLRTRIVVAAAQ